MSASNIFQLFKISQPRKLLDDSGPLETILRDFLRVQSESRNEAFAFWDDIQRTHRLRPFGSWIIRRVKSSSILLEFEDAGYDRWHDRLRSQLPNGTGMYVSVNFPAVHTAVESSRHRIELGSIGNSFPKLIPDD